jgi:DNA-binding transcriptional regulator YhcF (GntR family)
MASATFTLRAVDATRAAFASVQNSLTRLENQTKGIAKITKLAFGGEAVLGTLNMMKQRLDKVVESGADMGFSDEQIASAIRFDDLINGVLNTLTKIPIALAQMGFAIGNAFAPLTEGEIEDRIRKIKFDRAKKEIDGTVEATRKLQQEFDLLSVTQGQAADEARRMATEMFKQAVATMATDPAKGMKLQQDALAMLNRSKETGVTLDKEIVEAQRELNKTLPESQRIGLSQEELIDGLRNRYNSLTYEVSQLNVALSAFKDVGGPVGATQEEIIAKLKEMGIVSAQLNKLLDEQGKVAREAGQITAGAFENAILSGEKLRDTIKALARDLLTLLFRQQITEPLAKGIGSFFKTLPFFANGGPITGGQPAIVGERGPELFVPGASGRIISNSAMKSNGGTPVAAGVTVNYHIAAGVTRAELVPILETERKRLKAEIPDMVRRGGAYRAAFA